MKIAGAIALILCLAAATPLAARQNNVPQNVIPPVRETYVPPQYPPEAMRARVQGEVVVRFDILADGSVANVEVVEPLNKTHGLDDAALSAVKQWKYKPATKDGVAIAVKGTARVKFTLNEGPGETPTPSAGGPPPNEWPKFFIDAPQLSAGDPWLSDEVSADGLKVRLSVPVGWKLNRSTAPGTLLVAVSADERNVLVIGPPLRTPVEASPLPLTAARLSGFAEYAATRGLNGIKPTAANQIKVGDRWWLWTEVASSSGMLESAPPQIRAQMAAQATSDFSTWVFVTFEGGYQISFTCVAGVSTFTADRDKDRAAIAELFRAMISKVTITK